MERPMASFMYSYRNARMWDKSVRWSIRYALTIVSRERHGRSRRAPHARQVSPVR
jgi:hypothetical protein